MPNSFYVSIEGETQGKFKGDAAGFGKLAAGKMAGLVFVRETISPRDAASGLPTGKRQHKPIRFTKEWSAASPQLFKALTTNEILKTVLFEFVRANKDGTDEVHFTVKLTNASISRIMTSLDLINRTGSRFDGRELEQIELVFQTIEIEDKSGKTAANDDWVD